MVFLDTSNISNTKEIKASVVDDYILDLKNSGKFKDVTVNTSLRAVRAIIYYFQRLGYCNQYKINLIKFDKESKEPYTHHELKLLLERPKTNIFSVYRNWVIVNFLLATGVRVGEIINIQIQDINLDEAMVKIRKGKSRRERYIPLTKTLISILIDYLEIRQHDLTTDYLFSNSYGLKFREDSIKHAIAKYSQRRGISKTSIHLYRHTFAKMYILNGGDIFRLQKLLGHRSLEIVREYVNMFSNDLKKDFDSYNPLEQITGKGTPIRFK